MGGRLSYFVAEIYTNHTINHAIKNALEQRDISFICKYADDIFLIANPLKIEEIKKALEKEMNGLKIKIPKENEEMSIRYLDLMLTRRTDKKTTLQ